MDPRRVCIVAHFTDEPSTLCINRFNYLAVRLASTGLIVELVTSDFNHKLKRSKDTDLGRSLGYKYTALHEPRYKANISLKRFYSHWVFSLNLKKYLEQNSYDLLYCAIPSLSVGVVVVEYCKSTRTPVVFDVQDLWPEAMIHRLPSFVANFILKPLEKQATKIYRSDAAFISVSQSYLDRVLSARRALPKIARVSYIGVDLNMFDSIRALAPSQDDKIDVIYVGTLGESYDIENLIVALEIAQNLLGVPLTLVVAGSGPSENKLRSFSRAYATNVTFLGHVSYREVVRLLTLSKIAANTLRAHAVQSITNKIGDYHAAGLPILNSQPSTEYRALVDHYQLGLNCAPEDSRSIANVIVYLLTNEQDRLRMGKNSRAFAEAFLDREKLASEVIELINYMMPQR